MSSLENRKMMGEFCAYNGDYGDDGGVRDMGGYAGGIVCEIVVEWDVVITLPIHDYL